ncbi:MAG: hypothetical protein AABZ60_24185 [Planctomycetota bacterium]
MPNKVLHTVGIMDPNSLSFRLSLEGLFAYLQPNIDYQDKIHQVKTRRISCRPYNTLGAKSSCGAIINRGAHWNPHYNSFFMIIMSKVYLLNDMVSFKAIDKNTAYAQMYELGLHIPPTWALPQQDNSEIYNSKSITPELVFSEYELFDLREIGREIGYPAYLKPQNGGGWVGVERIEDEEELLQKYNNSGDRPMNLQKAIQFREFVRSLGVGPQILPMHYNPYAPRSHDRYLRSETQVVEQKFLTPKEIQEIRQTTKIVNAFYGWDHNSCEILLGFDGVSYPIDYANAYPDSSLISLHFHFPEIVKAMVRWMLFVVVSGKKKRVDFAYHWNRFFQMAEDAKKQDWSYETLLKNYEKLADEHFETERFQEFCEKKLGQEFEEKSLEFFQSDDFFKILRAEVRNYFKYPWEIEPKLVHYENIHRLWIQNEREKLLSSQSS